jgi:soluble lytic murein transglycosylase-like protein
MDGPGLRATDEPPGSRSPRDPAARVGIHPGDRARGVPWHSRMRLLLAALATLLPLAAPAAAQMIRIEDETGAIHYTNNPCHPTYQRLVPGACPRPSAATVPAVAEATADSAPAPGYRQEIEHTASRYGVDHRLVQAVVQVESGGNPRAVSPKGAQGLMQLMPARAAVLGVADAFDPRANLDGGVRHLRELLLRYDGNVRLALAAYNAGEDAVRLHGGVPPFPETQEYVRKVLSLYDPSTPGQTTPVKTPARGPVRSRL